MITLTTARQTLLIYCQTPEARALLRVCRLSSTSASSGVSSTSASSGVSSTSASSGVLIIIIQRQSILLLILFDF